MQFKSVLDFFNMGGYAFYVWSSFGLAALVVVIEVGQVCVWRRKILRQGGAFQEPEVDSECDTKVPTL